MTTIDKQVTLVFTKSPRLSRRFIRWLTNGRVNHVMIEYYDEIYDARMILEADSSGIRIVPAHKNKRNVSHEYVCDFDCSGGFKSVMKYIGDKYDWSSLFLLGFILLLKKIFKFKFKELNFNTKEQKCSELTANFLNRELVKYNGSFVHHPFMPEYTTPEDILRFCEFKKDSFTKV